MLRRLGCRVAVVCSVRSTASAPNLDEMARLYTQLTLKEVSQLQRLIFKELGHSDDFYEKALLRGLGGGGGGGVPMMAMPAAQAAAPAAEQPPPEAETTKKKAAASEKNSFDVKLAEFKPDMKIKLIKELRTVTNMSIKDAKDAIDKCPGICVPNMGKDDAEKLKKAFESVGAKVELL
jgi:ribosomal protein L7/L12